MSSKSWGYAPSGLFILVLIILLVWLFGGGRPFFSNSGRSIQDGVHDVGQDIKSAGRDAASSIRRTVE